MLYQKSRPYLFGSSLGFTMEMFVAAIGTPKISSPSKLEYCSVGGGKVSTPITRGVTSLTLDFTTTFLGDEISVRKM
jgi:hypothetical protein